MVRYSLPFCNQMSWNQMAQHMIHIMPINTERSTRWLGRAHANERSQAPRLPKARNTYIRDDLVSK